VTPNQKGYEVIVRQRPGIKVLCRASTYGNPDPDRYTFTLDEDLARAIRKAMLLGLIEWFEAPDEDKEEMLDAWRGQWKISAVAEG
jgi:hypothetical protein